MTFSVINKIANYEEIIDEVLDTIADMRESGVYDEDTLETLVWKLSKAESEEN